MSDQVVVELCRNVLTLPPHIEPFKHRSTELLSPLVGGLVDTNKGAVQMSRLDEPTLITMDEVAMLRPRSSRIIGRPTLKRHTLALVVAVGVLSACTPVVNIHGQVLDKEDLEIIEVGRSDKSDVQQRLGTASTSSVFSDSVWYYYSETTEQVGFFKPEVKERKIVAILFAPGGSVDNIVTYTDVDGKPVELVSRVTPTAGNELTLLQQLFGNVGRFASPTAQ